MAAILLIERTMTFSLRKIRPASNGLSLWLASLLGLAGWHLPSSLQASEDGPEWVPEAVFASVIGADLKQGYTLRADTWDGTLPVGETKPIRQQLLKGNEYRFYVSTSVPGAAVSVHLYDQDGNLSEKRSWKKEDASASFAGVEFRPSSTGVYYLILKVEKSPETRTAWNMAYAYK